MYIQNRRDSSNSNGCSPLQNCNGLISLKPAIAYFAYTYRYTPLYCMKKSFLLFLFFINVSITYAQEHIDLISFSAIGLCDSVDVELDKARAVIFDKSRDKNNFKIVIRVKTNCLFENLIGAYQLRGDTLNLLFTLKGAPIRGENVVYQSRINPENDGELEMALCDCYSELTYKFSNIDSEPILTLFSKQLYPPNQIYPISEPTFEIYKKDTRVRSENPIFSNG